MFIETGMSGMIYNNYYYKNRAQKVKALGLCVDILGKDDICF